MAIEEVQLPLAADWLSSTQLALHAEDIKRKGYICCFVQSHAVELLKP